MHCHCGTNNRAPRWTFTDPCKPGAREESASPARLEVVMYVYFPSESKKFSTKSVWIENPRALFFLYRAQGKIGVGFTIDTDFVDNFFDSEGKVDIQLLDDTCIQFSPNFLCTKALCLRLRSWTWYL